MKPFNREPIVIDAIGVAVAGGFLTITVPAVEFVNRRRFILCQRQFLPAFIGTEPVQIVSGTNTYPLIDKDGNLVLAGQIPCIDKFCLRFGANGIANTPHFLVTNDIPIDIVFNPVAVLEPPVTP